LAGSPSSKIVMARTIATTLGVLVAIVVALVWLLVSSFPDDSNHGYQATLRPIAPLSPAACRAELQALKSIYDAPACRAGSLSPWFELQLRNVSDHNGFPICRATAFNAAGQPLFDQDVDWIYEFPTGPPLPKGTALRFVWYFTTRKNDSSYVQHQPWKRTQIDHYSATCHGRPQSQVPI
jgi:hypothetical protein